MAVRCTPFMGQPAPARGPLFPMSKAADACRASGAPLSLPVGTARLSLPGSGPGPSIPRQPPVSPGRPGPAAYLLATRRFRGRALAVTLVELPLVLPPAVAGIGLLAAFGTLGLLGGTIDALGVELAFTQTAVVLAVAFVASPFYIRSAIAAFEAVDESLLDASRTLGAGPAKTFARVALPLAAGGLGAGLALAFARGIGEFGATIMFAGSLQGVTQTLSLAIYEQFDVSFDVALGISALLVLVSGALLLAVKVVPAWTRSVSIFSTPYARSASS